MSKDQGSATGKAEPNGVEWVEGQGAAEGPEVHGVGRATTDQDSSGGTRKPNGAKRTTVPGGVNRGGAQELKGISRDGAGWALGLEWVW